MNLNSFLKNYKKSNSIWLLSTALNISFATTLPYLIWTQNYIHALISLFCIYLILYLIAYAQQNIINKQIGIREDIKRLLINKAFIGSIPIFGLLSYWIALKGKYRIDNWMNKYKNDLSECWDLLDHIMNSWGYLHVFNIAAFNVIWVLVAFGQVYQYILIPISSFIISIYIVSLTMNISLLKQNELVAKRLINVNANDRDEVKMWRTCMKISFLSYIPGLNSLGLIPFFFLKGAVLNDSDRRFHQYINKCDLVTKILFLGSFLPIPYLISFISLDLYSKSTLLIIPLIVWIVSPIISNALIYISQCIWTSTEDVGQKQLDKVNQINLMTKISIYTSPLLIACLIPTGILKYRIDKLKKSALFSGSVG